MCQDNYHLNLPWYFRSLNNHEQQRPSVILEFLDGWSDDVKKIFSLDLIEETAGSNSFAREITLVPGPEAPKLLRPESPPDLLSYYRRSRLHAHKKKKKTNCLWLFSIIAEWFLAANVRIFPPPAGGKPR